MIYVPQEWTNVRLKSKRIPILSDPDVLIVVAALILFAVMTVITGIACTGMFMIVDNVRHNWDILPLFCGIALVALAGWLANWLATRF